MKLSYSSWIEFFVQKLYCLSFFLFLFLFLFVFFFHFFFQFHFAQPGLFPPNQLMEWVPNSHFLSMLYIRNDGNTAIGTNYSVCSNVMHRAP